MSDIKKFVAEVSKELVKINGVKNAKYDGEFGDILSIQFSKCTPDTINSIKGILKQNNSSNSGYKVDYSYLNSIIKDINDGNKIDCIELGIESKSIKESNAIELTKKEYNAIMESRIEFLEEYGFLSKATIGLKIKPHQDLVESFKKHEYPGLMNFVKKSKNIEELKYIKKDTKNGMNTLYTIRDRIKNCVKYGENKVTSNYYKGIKKKYLDKGITEDDVNKYIDWLENKLIPAINDRIKELSGK